jgi:hypothetical protein
VEKRREDVGVTVVAPIPIDAVPSVRRTIIGACPPGGLGELLRVLRRQRLPTPRNLGAPRHAGVTRGGPIMGAPAESCQIETGQRGGASTHAKFGMSRVYEAL